MRNKGSKDQQMIQSQKSDDTDDSDELSIDIVIIGAGFAGLGAANTFHQNGITNFLVLEARDRIGGRSFTSYELGKDIPVDLGSSWIQGKRRNPILSLVRQHGISYEDVSQSHIFYDGTHQSEVSSVKMKKLKKMYWDDFWSYMEEQQETRQDTGKPDTSVRQIVDNYLHEKGIYHNKEMRQLFETALHSEIVSEYAADLEDLSLFSWDDDEQLSGGDCFLAVGPQNTGYSAVVEALAKPFRSQIQLNSIVHGIKYGTEGVRISYACKGEVKCIVAKHTIITLPLGVLKANFVKFSPPLPLYKQVAIKTMGNGIYNKCILYWEDMDESRVFWPKEKEWIVKLNPLCDDKSVENAWLEFYNAYTVNGNKPVLVGFASGKRGSAVERLTDKEITEDAIASLRSMFGYDKVPDPTKSIVTRWETDEFSRGSYSFLAVGSTKQSRIDLARPVGDQLWFAGEATDTLFPSTTQGALTSGERAAHKLMEILATNNQFSRRRSRNSSARRSGSCARLLALMK